MADPITMPFGFAPAYGAAGPRKLPPVRPFGPGERIQNPDGSHSTEVSITVPDGYGGWMVVPQLWMGPNGVVDLRGKSDAAASVAAHLRNQYGIDFPTFKTIPEADEYAVNRSENDGAGKGSIGKQAR